MLSSKTCSQRLGRLLALLLAALAASPLTGAAQAQPLPILTSDASISSVACPAAGACVAVGSYQAQGGQPLGLLLNQAAGLWTGSTEAPLPAPAGNDPNVYLSSVACASAGNCATVGDYFDNLARQQGMVMNLRGGRWRPPLHITLPPGSAGNPHVTLNAVACSTPGNCTAVGSYFNAVAQPQAIVLSEAGWRWGAAQQVSLPGGASGAGTSTLTAVSCPAAGSCSAVGWYATDTGALQGLMVSSTAGGWGPGVELALPADQAAQPRVALADVACPAAGQCAAVGEFSDGAGDRQGIVVDQQSGSWGPAQPVSLPANASAAQATKLNSVACTAPGYCTAVGQYSDSALTFQGVVLTETARSWAQGLQAPLPADAAANQDVTLNSVACTAYETCMLAGTYFSRHPTGLLITEFGGRFKQPLSAFMPPGAAGNPYTLLDTLACAPGGYCAAAGNYVDGAGNSQGVLMNGNGLYWQRGVQAPLPGGLQTLLRHRRRHRRGVHGPAWRGGRAIRGARHSVN